MTENPIAPLSILETALYADDLKAAERFYGDLLGLEIILKSAGRHVFFRVGAGVLLVFRAAATQTSESGPLSAPPHGATGPGHMCFGVAEPGLSAWVEHLGAAGIPVEKDIRWPNGARSVYVRDPAGNSVEFAEPHLWG